VAQIYNSDGSDNEFSKASITSTPTASSTAQGTSSVTYTYSLSGFDDDLENYDQLAFKFSENFDFSSTVNRVSGVAGIYEGFGRWVIFTYYDASGVDDTTATKSFGFSSTVARWGMTPSAEKVRAYHKKSRKTLSLFELELPALSSGTLVVSSMTCDNA